jgi:hypothetical protein
MDVLTTVLRNRPREERERDVAEIRAHLDDLIADCESLGLERSAAIEAAVHQFDAAQSVPDDLLAATWRSRLRHLPPQMNALLYGLASSAIVYLPFRILFAVAAAHRMQLAHLNPSSPFPISLLHMALQPAFVAGVVSLWFLLATQGWRRVAGRARQWDTQWGTAVLWSISGVPESVYGLLVDSTMPIDAGSWSVVSQALLGMELWAFPTVTYGIALWLARRPSAQRDAYQGILVNVFAQAVIDIVIGCYRSAVNPWNTMSTADEWHAAAMLFVGAIQTLALAAVTAAVVYAGVWMRRKTAAPAAAAI